METFCATTGRSKYRPTLTSSSFCQTGPYNTNFRQNDYNFANSTRQSALLWRGRSNYNIPKSKGRSCSIALAAAAFVVLIAVLAIAGLALYMGALRTETPSPLLTFSCSVKVLRGDRFVDQLQEKTRKYKNQFEVLYQRSMLGPALISCVVEKFGNDTVTVHYRLTLNKHKIPRTINNIEKTIRDILLSDAVTKKPIFKNMRFDARSVSVKLVTDADSYQRVMPKFKEQVKTRTGVVIKPTVKSIVDKPKTNLAVTARLPAMKRPIIEEIDIKEDDLPVIQGSFKISKTEADISEKRNVKTEVTTIKPKSEHVKNATVKETAVTSSLHRTALASKSTTEQSLKTVTISTVKHQETMVLNQEKTRPSFTINPQFFDNEPWKPLYTETHYTQSPPMYKKQPVYTSFTNPGLSFHSRDTETLGSTSLKSHPIPINKLPDVTQASVWEEFTGSVDNLELTTQTPTENQDKVSTKTNSQEFVEIETLKYVPGSVSGSDEVPPTPFKWELIDGSTIPINPSNENSGQTTLKNLSSIFHNLTPNLGPSAKITRIDINANLNHQQNGEPRIQNFKQQETTTSKSSTSTSTTFENDFIVGQGQVEVVDQDELSLIMQSQTTKLPLVTLLPAKSNSGIGRPLRRRPNNSAGGESVENRSFPSGPPKQNVNIDFNPIKYVETSPSGKNTKQNNNNFNVMGILNFDQEQDDSHLPISTPTLNKIDLIRNSKMEDAQAVFNATSYEDLQEKLAILSMNSNISVENKNNFLTPEKLREISAISKLSQDNATSADISTKAVHSTYTANHGGIKILTKTFSKVLNIFKEDAGGNHIPSTVEANKTECTSLTVKCGDGQCLPETTRCNQLVDCNDGADEKNCNCADYLRSQYLLRKICDGVVDCWDFSDENHCDWCNPGQYVCGNSKLCIDKSKICDGIRDCPHTDDERQCVTVAPNITAADEFPYYSEGFLLVRKHGEWRKLCMENFENVISASQITWKLFDLGRAVCKAITYQVLDSVQRVAENRTDLNRYYELAYSFQNATVNKSSLSFQETKCNSGKVIKVTCSSLECGARPQAVKQVARIVGGGNAGLGAWPWQAALYKEGEFQCGATLLSDSWLLSAGHCFYHSLEEYWVARLGALRRGTTLPSPYEQLRPIEKIILHPDYIDAGFINDISILKMKTPVIFSDYVRPICLPPPDAMLKDGMLCTVVGWGQLFEIGRIFPDTLQEVEVPVISTSECRKRTIFLPLYRVTDDMFCAGYERGGRDACLGDSGGPLMCPELDGRWVLQGITSNGYGCARADRPGVYTKVANYVLWINSNVNDENTDNSTTFTTRSSCIGHRCPLGECLPKSRLCNGFIECSDGSDEKDCLI